MGCARGSLMRPLADNLAVSLCDIEREAGGTGGAKRCVSLQSVARILRVTSAKPLLYISALLYSSFSTVGSLGTASRSEATGTELNLPQKPTLLATLTVDRSCIPPSYPQLGNVGQVSSTWGACKARGPEVDRRRAGRWSLVSSPFYGSAWQTNPST